MLQGTTSSWLALLAFPSSIPVAGDPSVCHWSSIGSPRARLSRPRVREVSSSEPLCPRARAASRAIDFATVNNLSGFVFDVSRTDMKELVAACA